MEDRVMIRDFPCGTVTPPPSKSDLHRMLICAFLASFAGERDGIVANLGTSDDIAATLRGIKALGARYEITGDTLRMLPAGAGSAAAIDCGESGSTLRFLLPVAACLGREILFTGSGRLLERPIGVYEQVFAAAGARFVRTPEGIHVGGGFQAGRYEIAGNVSSQFISGLLLALPLLGRDSELRLTAPLESGAYVGMTMRAMHLFEVEIEAAEHGWRIPGGQRYRPCSVMAEADFSQAAFFLAAAALGRDVRCRGLNPGSPQGDRAILAILKEMGAVIAWEGDAVTARAASLKAVTVDAREIPDLIPPIAALCCLCNGESRVINAGRLRWKESDRLRALAVELGRLGADITESGDGLLIRGKPRLAGGQADARGDHRIAMAIAVAAIGCENPVELSGARSVRKSYPRFWENFGMKRLSERTDWM